MTFMSVPNSGEAKISIVGAPYDCGVTGRKGAAEGPQHIRKASHMLCEGTNPYFKRIPLKGVVDLGDFNAKKDGYLDRLTEYLLKINSKILLLGGDHSVTYSAISALTERYGNDFHLLHFDAHPDYWWEDFGLDTRINHGNFLYHLIEEGKVIAENVFQLGLRAPVPNQIYEWATKKGVTRFTSLDIHTGNFDAHELWQILSTKPVYVTFDIDCLDPAYAPGTGTPEVGGLHTWQVLNILRQYRGKIIGADVVEVAPNYDHASITTLAGATVAWYLLDLLHGD